MNSRKRFRVSVVGVRWFSLLLLGAILALNPSFNSSCSAQDPENPIENDLLPPGESNAASEAEKIVNALFKEISDLTPGGTNDKSLRAGITEAIQTFLAGDGVKANEQFDVLHEKFPLLPPSAFLMASLYYSTGNAQEANRRLEEAAETDPELPSIYNAFGRIAISQNRMTDALVLLEKSQAVADAGTFSEVEMAFFQKNHEDAMADLMLIRNDFGSARKYLESLIAKYPNMTKTIYRLAQLDFRQGNTDAALKQLENFKRFSPGARVPELMIASMLVQGDKEKEAGAWVDKALAKYPNDNKVLLEYVDWMIAHENFEAVDKILASNGEKISNLPAVVMLKGKMAFARQQYEEAESFFSELRATEPSNIEVSTMLAIAMAERNDPGKLEKAVQMATQNMQLQQQNAIVMAVLGYLLLKQEKVQLAGEWLNRASASGNVPPETAFYIASFLQKQGDKVRATELVNSALSNKGLFLYRLPAQQLQKELASTPQNEPSNK